MVKSIIFDFDGTLADTVGSIWREYQRVIAVMGLPPITHRQFTREVGRTWDDIICVLWPGIDPAEFTRNYRVDAEEALRIPGADEALKVLSGKYTLALMTSRGGKTLYPHMAEAGIDPLLFRGIYHRNNLKHNKPDPRALAQVCGELGFKKQETIYVGDSVIDAECAFDAGLGFVAVLTGGGYEDDFKAAGVYNILPSVASLPGFLEDGYKGADGHI